MKQQQLLHIFLWAIFTFCAKTIFANCTNGNCADGFGHYLWKSGEKYVGNWQNGKMYGHGVFYWTDGRKYIGEWEDGKMHGKGTMFYANGKIKSGYWETNQFVQLDRQHYTLSEENLVHGTSQVKMMCIDRPNMRQLVKEGDAIWDWTVRKFAGEDIHHRVYWQAQSSESFIIPTGVQAAHSYPTAVQDGFIWVAPLEDGEEMWAGVIYELFNIQNHEAFEQVEQDAMLGRCSKEDYIMRYAQLEYSAAVATADFYKTVWKPYSIEQSIESNPQYWFANIPPTFEAWIGLYDDPNGYPWHPYAAYYDELVKTVVEKY